MAGHRWYGTANPYGDYTSDSPTSAPYRESSPSRSYREYQSNHESHSPLPSPFPPSPYAQSTFSQPSRSYSGVSTRGDPFHESGLSRQTDPYHDSDSIPLNGRGKAEYTQTLSKPLPDEPDDDAFIRDVRDPDGWKQKRRRRKKRAKDGWFTGKITWVVFVLTPIQLIVFLAELIKNGVLTGSPIEVHPSFNPMIGPSPYLLINFGARYQPCMHNMPNVQNATTTISWPCPNATSTTGDGVSCSLSELCGFDGVPDPHPFGSIDDKPAPNQWWRFIIPIFIHAGIIHIAFNLLLQLTLGRDIEKLIGSIRFAVVYFAAGIFGFVLGGNFAANGIASCGCSGSLFGILAITLLDLLYNWKKRTGPIKDLIFICVDILVAFVLGLLPGLDNFSHIGGFLMGLVLGICLLRSPAAISRRTSPSPTRSRHERRREKKEGFVAFIRDPIKFFTNRRGVWWAWWLVRAVALVGVLIGFILLIKNFYVWGGTCSWCKYLSCLPVVVNGQNWCNVGNLNFTPKNETEPQPPPRRRDGLGLEFTGVNLDGLDGLDAHVLL